MSTWSYSPALVPPSSNSSTEESINAKSPLMLIVPKEFPGAISPKLMKLPTRVPAPDIECAARGVGDDQAGPPARRMTFQRKSGAGRCGNSSQHVSLLVRQ
ncbi:MAG: hypothetical protein N2689_04500 [Verrucomicrobiae bacterium]|nr:hypothetical protein [Verrucomicrobiae bacterium]